MRKQIFRQYDSRWRNLPYPGRGYKLNGAGCGCVSVTHVIIERAKYKSWTPADVQPYMKQFATYGDGTKRAGITASLKHYGMENVKFFGTDATMKQVFKELNKGGRIGVILFGGGKAPNGTVWTTGGHYVAFTKYKVENGKHWFHTKDSAWRRHDGWHSYENSMKGRVICVWSCTTPKSASETKKAASSTDSSSGSEKAATGDSGAVAKAYGGTLPSLKLEKSSAEVISDAIAWAKWIASDNDFHYGHGKDAHHNGCYFCGTNRKGGAKAKSGIREYAHTYCCNPFVHAAYAHGGGVTEMLEMCGKGRSYGFGKNEGYAKSSLFKAVGRKNLKAGDVLCGDHHVALYIGGGKVIQAGHEDDNKKNSASWNSSIAVGKWSGYKRCYRFTGKVSASRALRHGEVGKRVTRLQKFLKWYGCDISVDGTFGDKTLKAVKKFQKAEGLTADGSVGSKTLAKMKAVRK